MSLAKNILAPLLALLLVHPACCCALVGCCSGDSPHPAPIHSCCSDATKPSDSGEKKSPDNGHHCRCSIDQRLTESGKVALPCPHFVELPEPLAITLPAEPLAPTLLVESPKVEHHPPGSPIRILFSVFRL